MGKHSGIGAWFNAGLLQHGSGTYNRLVERRKSRLFRNLEDRVLEIGAETGASLPYYPRNIELIVLEIHL